MKQTCQRKTNTILFYSYVESNEQSELTSKIETDPQIESTLTAMGRGRLRGRRIKQKGKRTHGHGQQCGDCWYKGIKW